MEALPTSSSSAEGAAAYAPLEEAPRSERALSSRNLEAWPPLIISPSGPKKQQWDVVIMLCILYSAVVVPLRICFRAEAEGGLWYLEASMSLLFLADLILSFNVAYEADGVWITARVAIAKRYASSWLVVDAPSSVPVEIIERLLNTGSTPGSQTRAAAALPAFRILRLLRLVRVLRLLKVKTYVSRLEEVLNVNLRPLRVVSLLLQIVFIAHLLACGWFLTTWIDEDDSDELTWIHIYEDGFAADGPVSQQYLYSFYWALTTLSAQNPIPPTTDRERCFVVAVSLLNRLLFAYIVGQISALLSALDRQAAIVQDKLDAVKEYLYWRKAPSSLAIRIKRYYENYYEKTCVFDERTILKGLTPSLRGELVSSVCEGTLGRHVLFAKLSPSFQVHIFPLMKPLSFDRGDVIFTQGSPSTEMLFLLDGTVHLLSDVDGKTPRFRITTDEETFLEPSGAALLNTRGVGCVGLEVLAGMRRRLTARANTNVEALMIDKDDLIQLFKLGDSTNLRRMCNVLLTHFMGRERLNRLGMALRVAAAKPASRVRAACMWQLAWRRYCDREARRHDELCKLIMSRRGHHTVPGSGADVGGSARLLQHLQRLEEKQDRMYASLTRLEKRAGESRSGLASKLMRAGAGALAPSTATTAGL